MMRTYGQLLKILRGRTLEFKIKLVQIKFWQIGLFKFYKKGNISQCEDYNHIFILGSKDNIAQACILLKMLHA